MEGSGGGVGKRVTQAEPRSAQCWFRPLGGGQEGAKEGSSRSLEEGLANVANLSRDSIQYTEMVGE